MKVIITVFTVIALLIISSCNTGVIRNEPSLLTQSDLKFSGIAKTWDEGIPLGDGMLGALVWEKNGRLRFSLDRADLWDLRPTRNLDKPEWKYSWVKEQWEKNTYSKVQNMFDVPYDADPAPSKIPGGAMEFDIASLGEVESVELNINDALCNIKWKNGATLQAFVNAASPVGWFRFEGVKAGFMPEFIAPDYNLEGDSETDNSHSGQDLRRLEYPKGE